MMQPGSANGLVIRTACGALICAAAALGALAMAAPARELPQRPAPAASPGSEREFSPTADVKVADSFLGDTPIDELGDPVSKAGTAPALTLVTERDNGEQFMRDFGFVMPTHWRVNGRSYVNDCDRETLEQSSFACPADSEIGSAEGTLGIEGTQATFALPGKAYLVETEIDEPVTIALVFAFFELPNGTGVQIPPIYADIVMEPGDYRLKTIMPDIPRMDQVTLLNLRLDLYEGENRGLFRSPPINSCDSPQAFDWWLTSWPDSQPDNDDDPSNDGEQTVSGTDLVSLSDCGAVRDPFSPQATVSSSTTAAGAHPTLDILVHRAMDNAYLNDMKFTMPTGMLGSANATSVLCTRDQADQNACPAESKVAEATEKAKVFESRGLLNLSATVYAAEPEAGELARFYTVSVTPPIASSQIIVTPVVLNVLPGLTGLEATVKDLPPEFDLREIGFAFIGSTGADRGHPLLYNPSSCEQGAIKSEFGSEAGDVYTTENAYQSTDCESLPYDPKVDVAFSCYEPHCLPDVKMEMSQADGESTTRSTRVHIPKGFSINTKTKVTLCTQEQANADACPAESALGDVEVDTPLLEGTQRGTIYLAEKDPGSDAFMKVLARVSGTVTMTLSGTLESAPGGGFDIVLRDMPQVPLRRLKMNLNGGTDHGVIYTPFGCDTYDFTAQTESHSGKTVTGSSPITISGQACAPRLSARLSSDRPRAHPRLTLTAEAKSGAIGLSRMDVRLGSGKRKLRIRVPSGGRTRNIGTLSVLTGSGSKMSARLQTNGKRRIRVRGTSAGSRSALGGMGLALRKGRLQLTSLPNAPIKQLKVSLDGRHGRLITNPRRCGTIKLHASFKDRAERPMTSSTGVRIRCKR